MTKVQQINVKDTTIRTMKVGDTDYICITDIARQKNPLEPKDVVKNWMRLKNTIEYLGMWEMLNNPNFKGGEFDPLLMQAGSNAFTLNPSRWIELTNAIGLITKNGRAGGSYAQRDRLHKPNKIAIQHMKNIQWMFDSDCRERRTREVLEEVGNRYLLKKTEQ